MSQRNYRSSAIVLATTLFSLASPSARAADESVVAGTGKVKFNSLLQVWAYNDTTQLTDPRFNFRLRRAELKFSGSVVENTRWFLMVDAAKLISTKTATVSTTTPTGTVSSSVPGVVDTAADTRVLQDIGVAFTLTPELEFIAGQFKTPTTSEGLESSAELLFPERSRLARKYGDRRDPGAMVTYKWEMLKLATMISNGNGPNADDTTNAKDLNARADVKLHEMFSVGAFTTAGDFGYYKKGRWGANAKFSVGNALLKVEGVRATDSGANTNGIVADAGYSVGMWQPVARYDFINNGVYSARETTFGLNYNLAKYNSRIQAAYSILDDMAGANGSAVEARNRSGGLFQLNFQAAI